MSPDGPEGDGAPVTAGTIELERGVGEDKALASLVVGYFLVVVH